ncbi:hypothetical protein SISSUDRAFT_1120597 [Sistotremastrum suecicum HHB10207 ss-3]|uniref:Pre-mRNA-splicing factor CEF1 n=1 Tax=Sistotremastrum suecicum HHB10207 ss-3 TaxID=1314776 RepID=A0A166C208_9AGAM|nr:hypothetical protein SISSUDRAFT_1120597 [Sistotremastrum suecicum HHB10207 ss-3]
MVRIIIKGGVWKNTEDEVLKAAIAKYGKNQWARISSLLVRKTPKQCKARWYEWLDPSIKKTEWSKTEDEKLLHLAKLMPTQWRTIAPIVGRTATQCLERYQKLLDDAEAKDKEEFGLAGPGVESAPSADDVRRLRPGEIDPDPETKPARPDPIDMDEDEKEMLSEARARLANTQGKKAKRKARERQLEEARRLAMLQKKRELKAAGILSGSMRTKSKKKGMDYNADIPFEKKPAAGFYDTSDEQAREVSAPVGQSLRRLENKRKPAEEDAERKKRQRKDDGKGGDGPHQTKFVAARDAQIQKLKEAEQIVNRRKLVLPGAQVGEAELEEIVKIGQAGRTAREMVGDSDDASGNLLQDYESLERAKMARTPRTAPLQDTILSEARNLRNMTNAQTPLLGDENTPLHVTDGGTGFEGATPRHQVAFTPNPLATPTQRGSGLVSATPHSEAFTSTPLRTPMRDSLSINSSDSFSQVGDTPRERRQIAKHARAALLAGLEELPKPENNFELLVPEDEENVDADGKPLTEEDAAEIDARNKRREEAEKQREIARRSAVVRLGLPRPANVDAARLLEDLSKDRFGDSLQAEAERLINIELVQLLEHDSIRYPLPGTRRPGGSVSSYEMPDDELLAEAKKAIHSELATSLGFPDATEDQVKQGLVALAKDEDTDENQSWAHIIKDLSFDVESRSWVESGALDEQRRIKGLSALLDAKRERISKEASKAAKSEKKLGVQLGGYQARSGMLSKRLTDAFRLIEKSDLDLESFRRLSINESAVGPRRVGALKEEVERLEKRAGHLQARYRELDEERRERQERIALLEEQMMAEAEALNEAALEELDVEVRAQ